jgi:hypothetical protein
VNLRDLNLRDLKLRVVSNYGDRAKCETVRVELKQRMHRTVQLFTDREG